LQINKDQWNLVHANEISPASQQLFDLGTQLAHHNERYRNQDSRTSKVFRLASSRVKKFLDFFGRNITHFDGVYSWYFAIYDPSQCPICVGFLIFSSSLAIWTVILSLLTIFTLHVFKRQHVFESLNGLITSEEIQITQASLNQTINWKRYVKFKKFSKVLLLYDSPYAFRIFPKHIFEGEEDWKKFVDLVKIQINAKKKDTL
jgi:hypothetical protein